MENNVIDRLVTAQTNEETRKDDNPMQSNQIATDRNTLKEVFKTFRAIDVSGSLEWKEAGKDKYGNVKKLAYLTWAKAWEILMTNYPDAVVEKFRFDENGNRTEHGGNPYFVDGNGFLWVESAITIEGHTISQMLPVFDHANRSQKLTAYTVPGKYGEITIAGADSMSVNNSVQRCLVKNLALWGLGIDVFLGEMDEEDVQPAQAPAPQQTPVPQQAALANINAIASADKITQIKNYAAKWNIKESDLCNDIGAKDFDSITEAQYLKFMELGKAGMFKKYNTQPNA